MTSQPYKKKRKEKGFSGSKKEANLTPKMSGGFASQHKDILTS